MTGRRHIGLVAGLATLLAAFPLTTIFEQWTWLVQCAIAVFLIEGAGTLARTLRAPAWAQLSAMLSGLLVTITLLFGGPDTILGLLPSGQTFTHFGQLLNQAGTGIREMGIPVGEHEGLQFLTVLGVGGVAICVDVCAVILRRPALAGLPMLAIYSVPVAVHQDSVPVLPFIAGAAGFLWLLVIDNVDRVRRFGRRFTGDGRDIDVWEPSPLAAAGRRMAIVGVLLAIMLPLAVPGMTTGLLDRFGSGGDGPGNGRGTGGSRSVNLWALLEGTLKQDDEADMIRVTTKDPKPRYVRFGTADDLQSDGFRNRGPAGRPAGATLPDPRRTPRDGVKLYEGKATVDVVNLNMGLLPVFSDPVALRKLDSTWLYDTRQNVVFSNRSTTAGKKYEFDYVRADYDPDALRRAKQLPSTNDLQRFYTSLPDDIRDVRDTVARVTADKTTPYDKVLALYEFFAVTNGFTYSLSAKADTGGPAIVEFLTKKTGYCVQYAAALAWLVRAAGRPARVAFGFTLGAKHDGDTYTLTNHNLHAWTEVYFDGFGWVPFDATPSTYISGSVSSAWAPDVNAQDQLPGGVGPTPGAGTSGGTDSGDINKTGEDPRLNDDGGGAGGGGTGPGSPNWPGYLVLGAVLVLALLAAPAVRRALLRRRRRSRRLAAATGLTVAAGEPAPGEAAVVVEGGPGAARARRDAHAAWDELIDTLVDFRLPVDAAETPRATAERVVRDSGLRDAPAGGARLLGYAEERARYARVPLVTDELTPSLRSVRRALSLRASRRTRIVALLLPPSVLQRWRAAVVSWSAATSTALSSWGDTITRLLSPRRLIAMRSRS